MKIAMLLGSPHRNGTSATLAENFEKGAVEKGHTVEKIFCADMNVHPCIGCNKCSRHGVCVWTDSMPKIEESVMSADVVAFVTPVYYGGMTAQLKTVVDRFYSFNTDLIEKKNRFVLITAAAEKVCSSTEALNANMDILSRYLQSPLAGIVNAVNVGSPEALKGTDYCQKAYELGKSL